jgi:hypothetical protein
VADADGLLLGLDAGNTVIKAVLFDRQGRQLARSGRNGISRHPQPGYVERDPEELWRDAGEAIRDCVAGPGRSGPHLRGRLCRTRMVFTSSMAPARSLAFSRSTPRCCLANDLAASGEGCTPLADPGRRRRPSSCLTKRNRPIYEMMATAFFAGLRHLRLTGERVWCIRHERLRAPRTPEGSSIRDY